MKRIGKTIMVLAVLSACAWQAKAAEANDTLVIENVDKVKIETRDTVQRIVITGSKDDPQLQYEQRIEEKHVNVDISFRQEQCLVWADPDRISQVLVNLINNAIKYTPDGTPIDIVMTSQGAMAQVTVTDYGPGIPDEDKANIFDKFYFYRRLYYVLPLES